MDGQYSQTIGGHLPSGAHENRILWRTYLPHALFVLQSKEFQNDGRDREFLVQKVAECLCCDGRFHEAGALFEEAFEKKSKRLNEEMLNSTTWLAHAYRKQGRWTVIETRKTVLGPEYPDTLSSMAGLSDTYQNQGRWMEALLGPEHPSILINMSNLANIFRMEGRWTEAEKLEVQVMVTFKTVLRSEHPDTLAGICNLPEFGTMDGGGKAGCASDGNKEESTRA